MNLKDFRSQYPQYNDLTDEELAKGLHQRYYSDLPFDQFATQIGLQTPSVMDSYDRSAGQQALDAVKATGTGLGRGVTALGGLPGEVYQLVNKGLGHFFGEGSKLPDTKLLPTSTELNNLSKQFGIPLDYKPKDALEKYLLSGAEGYSGMAASGAKLGGRIMGLASGLAGQGAEDFVGGESPSARFMGSVAPILAYAGAKSYTPQSIKSMRRTMRETPDADLELADAVRKMAAERLGTPTLLTQGVEKTSPLTQITEEIARSPQGATVRKVLERQLPVGQQAIDDLVESMSTRPISNKRAREIAEAGQDALALGGKNVQNTPLGSIFGKGQANYDSYERIFNPNNYSAQDVRYVYGMLNKANPEAWPDIMKRYLQSTKDNLEKISGGRSNQDIFDKFVSEVRSPNFIEGIKGVAKATGQNPSAAAKGAETLLDALQVIARERGAVGQIDVGEFRRVAGANPLTAGLKSANVFTPFWRVAGAIERSARARAYSKIADALTSPDGVKILQDFRNYSPTDERVMAVARSLVTLDAVND